MAKKVDCSELAATIAEIALNYGQRADVKGLDGVVLRVQSHFPALGRKDVVDSIIAYTASRPQKQISDVAARLAEIKAEARMDAKLRERIELLEGQIKSGELEKPGPKSRAAVSKAITEMRAIRDRLTDEKIVRQRIAELDKKIAAGDTSTRPAKPRNVAPELIAMRDRLQKRLDTLRHDSRAAQRLTAQIAALEKKIKAGDLSTKPQVAKPVNPSLQPLIARRDRLRDALNSARISANRKQAMRKRIDELERQIAIGQIESARKRQQKPLDGETQSLQQQRDRLQREADLRRQIDDMVRQLETGELSRRVVAKREVDEQLERLMFERGKLKRQINERINALKPRNPLEKYLADPFNTFRAIMTSFDLSAVLRQGGFIAFAHPVRAAKSFGPMLRAFGSERYSARVAKDIESRRNAILYDRAGLYIAPLDASSPLSKREEAYMTRWADKIPGVKNSERAYVTFLNKLRADSFDAMLETLGHNGEVTQAEAEGIANFINVATGRGKMSKFFEGSVPVANALFFAPRNVLSRIQILTAQPIRKGGSSRTRILIAKEYAKFLVGFGAALGLLSLGADELETDPRSSDFLKARFGDSRIDIGTGLLQPVVLASRLISGKMKSSKTGKVTDIRGEDVPFGGATGTGLVWRFGRTKFSPLTGTIGNIIDGENVIGEEVTVASTARDLTIPMSVREIYQAMESEGIAKGAALGLATIFGAGLHTYSDD